MDVSNRVDETWKNIPGYGGIYQVSNLGNVRVLECKRAVRNINRHGHIKQEAWMRRGRQLRPIRAGQGSYYVHLYDMRGNRRSAAVKYLVAQAFLPEFCADTRVFDVRQRVKGNNHSVSNLYIKSNTK